MGLLERLLTAQVPSGVPTINGQAGALAFSATSPLKLMQVGASFVWSIGPAGQQRGDILHNFAGGWGPLHAGSAGQFLRANGVGSDLTWADPPIAPNPPGVGRAVLTSNTGVSRWTQDLDLDVGNLIQTADEGAYQIHNGSGTFNIIRSDGVDLFIGDISTTGPSHIVTLRGASEVRLSAGTGGSFRTQLIVQPDYVRVNAFGSPSNPNAGGRGVLVLADAEVVPSLTPTGSVAAYSEGGRFKVRSTGGTIKHVVSAWGAQVTSTTRFLSSTSGATFTGVAVITRDLEIAGSTVAVVCLT